MAHSRLRKKTASERKGSGNWTGGLRKFAKSSYGYATLSALTDSLDWMVTKEGCKKCTFAQYVVMLHLCWRIEDTPSGCPNHNWQRFSMWPVYHWKVFGGDRSNCAYFRPLKRYHLINPTNYPSERVTFISSLRGVLAKHTMPLKYIPPSINSNWSIKIKLIVACQWKANIKGLYIKPPWVPWKHSSCRIIKSVLYAINIRVGLNNRP